MQFRKSEAPAAERNKDPILQVLKDIIKVPNDNVFPSVKILEIASGTGQHISYFAKNLSLKIFWQPSEYDRNSFSSICAYIQEYNLKNVAPPVFIDIRQPIFNWKPQNEISNVFNLEPVTKFDKNSFDYVYNSNLMHISSYDCTEGLFHNSSQLLKSNGCLITYGPYGQNGIISPESNVKFDEGLRKTDPSWGIRDVQLQLLPLAAENGLTLEKIIDMPANNKVLVWRKQ